MTREEQLDWLCRLRSEVKIHMPIEWVDHFEDALTESINTLSQELGAERQIAKWEFHCQHWSKCSICGYADKFANKWNYCPNCGAKMENVEKSLIDIKTET